MTEKIYIYIYFEVCIQVFFVEDLGSTSKQAAQKPCYVPSVKRLFNDIVANPYHMRTKDPPPTRATVRRGSAFWPILFLNGRAS